MPFVERVNRIHALETTLTCGQSARMSKLAAGFSTHTSPEDPNDGPTVALCPDLFPACSGDFVVVRPRRRSSQHPLVRGRWHVGQQFLYDEGTHIPLVVRGPGVASGKTRTDLVEHIDIAAVSLAAAGIDISEKMEGRNILAECYQQKQAVIAGRDRCGEAADRVRSVRSDRYLYIRNFYPQRPHLMPSNYKDSKLIIQRLRELHATGKLSALSEQLLCLPTRPAEELYLYGQDRWQTNNLATDPAHAEPLQQHRASLDRWIKRTNDPGPESPEVYVREIEDQMKSTRNKASRETFRRNAELYQRWSREGK